MSTLNEISAKKELASQLTALPSSTLVVLYFYTPWTAFSTPMSTALSDIASRYPVAFPPSVSFFGIDGKKSPEIAKEYEARTAPCVVFLRNGKVLEMIKGSDPVRVQNAVEHYSGIKSAMPAAVPDVKSPEEKEALTARLSKLVNSAHVMLFMKGTPSSPRCRFSRRMVGTLQAHGVEFDYFDIMTDEEVRESMKEFGEWPTYPQLWVAGELIGGLEIVRIILTSRST